MTTEQKKVLRELADKYGLGERHFFISKHFVVLNKVGIGIIAEKENIDFVVEPMTCDRYYASCYVVATRGIETTMQFASASPENSQNSYYLEMAIKRAKSKCVLDLVGAYSKGIYSEDESDEFN